MSKNPLTHDKEISINDILKKERNSRLNKNSITLIIFVIVLVSFWQSGMFDGHRLSEGLPAIGVLISEMIPPNFARWQSWVIPMIETITMSVAGTAIAILLSLPIAFLASQKTTPNVIVYYIARMFLNTCRAIPELIMGIIFVAAVGFSTWVAFYWNGWKVFF